LSESYKNNFMVLSLSWKRF